MSLKGKQLYKEFRKGVSSDKKAEMPFGIFSKIRHHTTKKAHKHISKKIKWYDTWHKKKYHKHVHVSILAVYILSIIFGIFYSPSNTQAALVQTTKTVTTKEEFDAGYFDTTISTEATDGEVKIGSIDG